MRTHRPERRAPCPSQILFYKITENSLDFPALVSAVRAHRFIWRIDPDTGLACAKNYDPLRRPRRTAAAASPRRCSAPSAAHAAARTVGSGSATNPATTRAQNSQKNDGATKQKERGKNARINITKGKLQVKF